MTSRRKKRFNDCPFLIATITWITAANAFMLSSGDISPGHCDLLRIIDNPNESQTTDITQLLSKQALKEFILETISAITDATSELQEKYSGDDVIINPPSAQSGNDVYQTGSSNYTMRRVQNISFDVAVTASSEKAVGGKAGIKVLSIELGADGRKAVSDEQVSRVSFEVPMTLKPSDHEAKNTAKGVSEEQEPAEVSDQ